jgi:carbamoyl-phosphate synthase large subunit
MVNVLIASAGGPAAVGLIKSLRKLKDDIKIVALDCNKYASGLYLADEYYVVKAINEESVDFNWNEFVNIIVKENINLIIPTGEADLLIFGKYQAQLAEIGVTVFISNRKVLDICRDKYKFWVKCDKLFKTPKPIDAVFQKSDIGSGSRGIKLIESTPSERLWEYLPGKEYTVDVFCDKSSNSLGTVVRERVGIKSGISVQCNVIRHPELESTSEILCAYLNIKGPCNIQFKEDKNGIPRLIECNPRLGGGTYFSTLAGVNPAEIYIKLYNEQTIKKQYAKEIAISRYFEEIIL